MDRFATIKVFVAIAEAGSLSGAGKRLGMPLSTVSRHLKALEDELETRLITRTTRRLMLTEPGRSYAATCRRVLDELDDAARGLAGEHAEPRGELALTAPVVFGRLHVLPVVTAFLSAYPRVVARMLLVDRIVDLVEEGLDVGRAHRQSSRFEPARDAARRDPLYRLRESVLSRRAGRAGDPGQSSPDTIASASTRSPLPIGGASAARGSSGSRSARG